MRALNDMAEKVALRLAGAIAPHAGIGDLASGEGPGLKVFTRRLAIACAVSALAAPLLLSLPLGFAVALPAGAALAACLLLVGLMAALMRFGGAAQETVAEITARPDPYALCPGLVLHLDAQGVALSVSGRDASTFTPYLIEAAGRHFIEQIHVADRLAFATALDSLREGEGRAMSEFRLERRAGSGARYLRARASMTAMTGDEGELTGVFCQVSDMCDELALRDAALSAEREAENAHEAKSRFLAAVSHELRTPLNAILGFSDILIGEYFGRLENDRQREYVRLIRQSGGHLLSVVNTMLDMSKIEAGRYELLMDQCMVADVMNTCEAMLSLQAKEKGVTLTARVQRDLGEVVADQRALQQILINLVGNAIKFTDAGGVVSMDATIERGWLKIAVSDTGIGIAPEKLALIGQPFMQVQNDLARHYEGTGLGLALVKGLVALHGGVFAIESKPGEGTLITVSVPADGSGAAAAGEVVEEERTVEFPPRLTNRRMVAVKPWDDHAHENAQAKSA